jgi:hypothetical protein
MLLKQFQIVVVLAALAFGANALAAGKQDKGAQYVTDKVAIGGAVEHPLTLSVAELKAFPPQQLGNLPVVCQSGATTSTIENLKGVRLRDILEKANVVSQAHNDVKKMVVVASASDGYKVVFSWSEIFNSPVGEGVLVFFERDGKPLDEGEGRIALISAKDLRTGPRHVKWLNQIEVKKIVE